MEKINFKAEINDLMNIIINNFYSNTDIFLRELISNSSDALNKLKFNNFYYKLNNYFIKISTDKINNILNIHDNGIGMSKEELITNLGTIANSGTKKFFESLKTNKENINLIGQFGMGFYSSFLVADKVKVISKKDNDAYIWESESKKDFYISKYN